MEFVVLVDDAARCPHMKSWPVATHVARCRPDSSRFRPRPDPMCLAGNFFSDFEL